MFSPRHGAALIIDLLHRKVGHEAVGCCPVPVILVRLEEHAVTRADDLDLSSAPLAEADALRYVDGLAVGVGVPRSARARREVDAASRKAGWL